MLQKLRWREAILITTSFSCISLPVPGPPLLVRQLLFLDVWRCFLKTLSLWCLVLSADKTRPHKLKVFKKHLQTSRKSNCRTSKGGPGTGKEIQENEVVMRMASRQRSF